MEEYRVIEPRRSDFPAETTPSIWEPPRNVAPEPLRKVNGCLLEAIKAPLFLVGFCGVVIYVPPSLLFLAKYAVKLWKFIWEGDWS